MKDQQSERKKLIPTTVYTEMAHSPGILNFVCNRIIASEPCVFTFDEETVSSPLAAALFQFDYVKRVAFDKNVITVTKGGQVEWYEVSAELRAFIRDYLMHGKPVIR